MSSSCWDDIGFIAAILDWLEENLCVDRDRVHLTGLSNGAMMSYQLASTHVGHRIAFFLAATHVAGVISFGAGAISFTHVLKATEPVWSALISAVVFRDFLPLPVYPSLAPTILSCAPFLAALSPYLGPYLSPNPNPTRTLTLLEP